MKRENEDEEVESEDESEGMSQLFLNDHYTPHKFRFEVVKGGSSEEKEVKEEIVMELLLLSSASTDFDLTGQVLWPAARFLCSYLSTHGHSLVHPSTNILELGAGVGLCGLLADYFNPNITVLTEGNKEVMKILSQNVQIHLDAHHKPNHKVQAIHLWWGEKGVGNMYKQMKASDEHTNTENIKFDLVLGSDIIFWEDYLEDLIKTVSMVMSDKGQFLCAYFSRSLNAEKKLWQWVEQYGLCKTLIQQESNLYLVSISWRQK
eukprot:TRINITY_DN10827_c0_g1_i1.p1 TRINITY_DN10827_c0_g1~~TRINITY_DN10827_c0_g1_i1.p1  ORF type:complete len:262 (-),score=58.83 TRINITY_DN10827_c0_g1_i1:25-810(-)